MNNFLNESLFPWQMSEIEDLRPVEILFLLNRVDGRSHKITDSAALAHTLDFLITEGLVDFKPSFIDLSDTIDNVTLRPYEQMCLDSIGESDYSQMLYATSRSAIQGALAELGLFEKIPGKNAYRTTSKYDNIIEVIGQQREHFDRSIQIKTPGLVDAVQCYEREGRRSILSRIGYWEAAKVIARSSRFRALTGYPFIRYRRLLDESSTLRGLRDMHELQYRNSGMRGMLFRILRPKYHIIEPILKEQHDIR